MALAVKNLFIGLAVCMCIGLAGYGWVHGLQGWGWWLPGAVIAIIVLG